MLYKVVYTFTLFLFYMNCRWWLASIAIVMLINIEAPASAISCGFPSLHHNKKVFIEKSLFNLVSCCFSAICLSPGQSVGVERLKEVMTTWRSYCGSEVKGHRWLHLVREGLHYQHLVGVESVLQRSPHWGTDRNRDKWEI